jgi:hypothetical protein
VDVGTHTAQPEIERWFVSTDRGQEGSPYAGIRRLYCELIRIPDPFNVRVLLDIMGEPPPLPPAG